MKKYLNYLEGEKETILEQHRSAIRKNLLLEDEPSLPNKTILGTGVDKYDYKRENGKYFTKQKNATSWTDITGTKYEQPIRQNIFKDFTQSTSSPKIPFTNKVDGDKFRQWVNRNYPNVAKLTSLDLSGSFNNPNINMAWNYTIGNRTLGAMYISDNKPEMKDVKQTSISSLAGQYSKYSEAEPDPTGIKSVAKRTIELSPSSSIPQIFKGEGGERLNKEIYYINSRSQFNNKPFFVLDPRMKIVAAFDKNHNFIRLSQTVEGKNKQREIPLTYKEWCEAIPGGKYVTNKGCTKPLKDNYKVLEKIEAKTSSPGIYAGSSPYYEKGYTGKKGIPNILNIKTLEGLTLPMAIHALVPQDDRVTADAELKSYLGNAQKTGNIPKEYTALVNRMLTTKKYDLSSGCFNVDAEFINDPKVQQIMQQNPYIFVMSETKDFYLVQVDPEKGTDFFSKLKGDGNFCKPPTSVGLEVGGEELKLV